MQQRSNYLHPSQRDVFLDQMANIDSPHHNIGGYVQLRGALNEKALQLAIASSVEVFDVFKMRFSFNGSEPVSYFDRQHDAVDIVNRDFSAQSAPEAAATAWMQERFNMAFAITRDVLFEFGVLKITVNEHWFFLRFHHLITDGVGISIWLNYIVAKYKSLLEGQSFAVSYPGYEQETEKAVNYYNSAAYEEEGRYWKAVIGKKPEKVLPRKFAATTQKRSGSYVVGVAPKQRELLEHITTDAKISLQQLTIAALIIYLGKTSAREEFVFGIPVHKRTNRVLRNTMGMVSGMLPFKGMYKPGTPVKDLIKEIAVAQKEAYRHRHFIVSDLSRQLGHNFSEGYLMEIVVNYALLNFTLDFGTELEVQSYELGSEYAADPLRLWWRDYGPQQGLDLRFDFQYDYFSNEEIELLSRRLLFIMEQLQNGDHQIDTIEIIPKEEERLLKTFNNTDVTYPGSKTIIELIAAQVALTPDAVAVTFDNSQLTYAALHSRSNQLAAYLHQQGVKAETLVAVCMERSLEMIIAILGILKAGGAYVPVDPEYPAERIAYILEDTAVGVMLTNNGISAKLPVPAGVSIIAIDSEWEQIAKVSQEAPECDISPEQAVYVIYTSGSTGKPKGVVMEHGGLANRLLWAQEYFTLLPEDRVLQKTNFCFDVSVWELLWPLMAGARLVMAKPGGQKDNQYLKSIIAAEQISVIHFVPSMLDVFLGDVAAGDCPGLKKIICSGEVLKLQQVQQCRQLLAEVTLYNLYGPTEAAIDVTSWEAPRHLPMTGRVPIGKPVSNTRIYIVDANSNLLPVGCVGELCIGGVQVARGYLNRTELTQEKFIADPFSRQAGARLYRTGDLCCWLPDGNIEYIGRIDDQVKIRGYRVEPGEVEQVLLSAHGVKEAAVVATEDKSGNKQLIGYVVALDSFNREELMLFVRERLPEYLVPSLVVEVDHLPRTSNGKLDRKALPAADLTGHQAQGYTAPRTDLEVLLVKIWEELLGITPIGIADNFFELGGHSLLAMRVVSAIRRELELEPGIRELFLHPTVEGLSNYLQKLSPGMFVPKIEPMPRPERIPLSYSQERLWFIDQLEGSVHYHMPVVLRIKGAFNHHALAEALRQLVNRHEVFRTVIIKEEGAAYQQVLAVNGWNWEVEVQHQYKEDESSLSTYIEALVCEPFDLMRDHKLRAKLIELDSEEHVLVLVLHHIASDGWSMSILVEELIELYNSYEAGRQAKLKELPVQYIDYALWQRRYLQGDVLEKKLAYWKNTLQNIEPLNLPVDRPRAPIQDMNGAIVTYSLSRELKDQLKKLAFQQDVTLYMVLLTVFKVLLYRYSGQEDIVVGSPVANRMTPEIEPVIGFFVNTLVLRSNLGENPSFIQLLQQVKETTLSAYEHQEVPFEKLVEAIVTGRDMSRHALFQVLFVLQNTPTIPALKLGNTPLIKDPAIVKKTKFDLTLSLTEEEEGLQITMEYCSDLFNKDTILRLLTHYERLLHSVLRSPREKIAGLGMLTVEEEQRLLTAFNNTKTAYEKDATIVSLFEEQAIRTPVSIAIEHNGITVTYKELHERSNQLAHYLQGEGVTQACPVPICIERSVWMIIGLLGILKTGGAYVPLDPTYPADRLQYMVEDIQAPVVVTSKLCEGLLDNTAAKLICIDRQWEQIDQHAKESITHGADLHNPAYIIYTSGSTGKPKGVSMSVHALTNLLLWHNENIDPVSPRRVLQFASLNFDASFQEIFSALCFGGTICLIDEESRKDMHVMLQSIASQQINHLFIPYIVLKNLAECAREESLYPDCLEAIFCAGEQLRLSADIQQFSNKTGLRLLNYYGPSETHVASFYEVTASDYTIRPLPPIGKPVPNTTLYILGKHKELCAIGVLGELHIGGVQVSAGYWNREGLTEKRFIGDPFSNENGARLYCTGDMARWLADGNIEFNGRFDDQVKIRGCRVELGEVETVLQQSDLVTQVVVKTWDHTDGNKHLIAYVVPAGNFDKENLLSYIESKLPLYMVPDLIIEVERLPFTVNGKVDKNALPAPPEIFTLQYTAPRTETEQILTEIWQNILLKDRIGIYDNFFELGGHSLLATRVAALISRHYSIPLPVKMLFTLRNINDLGKYIELEMYLRSAKGENNNITEVIEI